jgi:hypothetical protein
MWHEPRLTRWIGSPAHATFDGTAWLPGSAKFNFAADGYDVDFLTQSGTKTRAGHLHLVDFACNCGTIFLDWMDLEWSMRPNASVVVRFSAGIPAISGSLMKVSVPTEMHHCKRIGVKV